MLPKQLIIILSYLLLSACLSTTEQHTHLSKDKQADLYLQMGTRYLEMNMLKIAKDKLQTALSLDPNNAEIYNTLGVMYERLNQFESAQQAYSTAFSLDQNNPGINNNYGRFLCDRGDDQTAKKLLQEAIDMPLNNRKWFAYTNLGRCELKNGQQAIAETYFRQALRLNKDYPPALVALQKISYNAKKYMSARAFLERYLAVANHTPETLWYGLQTERALGNSKIAENYQEKLFRLFPTSKQAQQLKATTFP